jgi:hypothetical protein
MRIEVSDTSTTWSHASTSDAGGVLARRDHVDKTAAVADEPARLVCVIHCPLQRIVVLARIFIWQLRLGS